MCGIYKNLTERVQLGIVFTFKSIGINKLCKLSVSYFFKNNSNYYRIADKMLPSRPNDPNKSGNYYRREIFNKIWNSNNNDQ